MGILVDVTVIYRHVLTTLDVFAVQAQARPSVAQSAFRGVFPHLIDKIITSFLNKVDNFSFEVQWREHAFHSQCAH